MKFRIELSVRASADIRDILSYTMEIWGQQQVYTYQLVLENALAAIEHTPTIGHAAPGVQEEILCFGAGKHLIFYRIHNAIVYILRVLHSKMDYVHHLDKIAH